MMKTIWIPVVLAGCSVSDPTDGKTNEPLALTPSTVVLDQGRLEFDTTVFAENPTTQLNNGDLHGYNFKGKTGAVVTIAMAAQTCGTPDTVLDLFAPADASGDRGVDIVDSDDDSTDPTCTLNSKISSFTLPADGDYLIVASSFLQKGGGHYSLTLTCNSGDNGECAQAGQPSFQSSRIAQTDIDKGVYTPAELFSLGFFLFKTVFRVEDGMGNALTGEPAGTNPPPNFRTVHDGNFGAPEAQSCTTCHNVGGVDGAGTIDRNIFQIGDGVNKSSGLQRNPPMLLGLGFRQAIGAEMSTELQGELATAKAAAATQGAPVTAQLTSKGVAFGSIVANADGTVDTTGLQGIDPDLVVKPFGWKGRESLLRRFIEGGLRVHFGMETSPSIAGNCAAPVPLTFGTGSNCNDPDGDGVVDEITEGQLTSLAMYMGLRQTPVRVPPSDPKVATYAAAGEQLFNTLGCNSCHVGTMQLNRPVHVEPADTTGGAGITVSLVTDAKSPHPATNTDGSMTVELWSDFKRHDMGTALADSKPFKTIAPQLFITTPLWGVSTSPPYLHDGRAATLNDAILGHAGEAQSVRDAYAALSATQQAQVQAFLGTLGRSEEIAAPPPVTVDLSGFTLIQTGSSLSFKLPAGTTVPHGGYVVVARNATQAAFQTFYGKTLGANVTYINSASAFPSINGSETYSLEDGTGTVIDGPSVAEPSKGLEIFQRVSGALPAGTAASWTIVPASAAAATPGSGQTSTGANRIYISEFADAAGASNFVYEYVEIFVE